MWGFRSGHHVIDAVLTELDKEGLKDATEIVLSGESAGGIGVWPNLDWVAERCSYSQLNKIKQTAQSIIVW